MSSTHPWRGFVTVSRATALVAALAALLVLAPPPAHAYIPAQATNETDVAASAGQNFSDVSNLSLQWYPGGSYSGQISYQLVGADSMGISKVCLVSMSFGLFPACSLACVLLSIHRVAARYQFVGIRIGGDVHVMRRRSIYFTRSTCTFARF